MLRAMQGREGGTMVMMGCLLHRGNDDLDAAAGAVSHSLSLSQSGLAFYSSIHGFHVTICLLPVKNK